jgi:hypothetical protein
MRPSKSQYLVHLSSLYISRSWGFTLQSNSLSFSRLHPSLSRPSPSLSVSPSLSYPLPQSSLSPSGGPSPSLNQVISHHSGGSAPSLSSSFLALADQSGQPRQHRHRRTRPGLELPWRGRRRPRWRGQRRCGRGWPRCGHVPRWWAAPVAHRSTTQCSG